MNAISKDDDPSARATIGVLRETKYGERRVALIPGDVRRLASTYDVIVEEGAGVLAGFSDRSYEAVGARVVSNSTLHITANVLVGVRVPENARNIPFGAVLISLHGRDASLASILRESSVDHLVLERMPRITRAQNMDVLSSQAAIAGYSAVLEGARRLPIILPMMTTAAGVLRPANMIALGAGVAGLQALATARRLGAVTHGFDVRAAAQEQVQSVGATFVSVDTPLRATETVDGYARDQSHDEQLQLRRALESHLVSMNLIITTAQIPGRRAPLLIDDESIAQLTPGTVIVDMAAESGGNTTRTQPDQEVVIHGVTILGPTQLSSMAAGDASRLFSGNIRHLLEHLGTRGKTLRIDPSDDITAALLGAKSAATSEVSAR